eukprot:COSAG01_NODE_46566_length_399_cov_0.686667_1_plen_63_part_01
MPWPARAAAAAAAAVPTPESAAMPGTEPHEPQFPPPPLDEYGDSAPLTSKVAEQAPTHAAPDT